MACDDYKDQLMGYLDDELDAETTKLFEKHLAGCPDCTGELEEFKKLKSGVLLKRHNALIAAGGKKEVFNPFQPISLFLGSDGFPLYLGRGALYAWQFDYAVEKHVQKVAGRTETKKPAEAKKSAGTEEARRSQRRARRPYQAGAAGID